MPVYQDPLHGVSRSVAYAEAMAVAPIGDAVLTMLETTHDDLAAPIRLVLNDRNVTARLESDADFNADEWVEHIGISLGFQPPEETDGSASPPARFWVDGVSAMVAPELERVAGSLEPVGLTIRTYMSSDLTCPASLPPLRMELRDIEITESRVIATAAYADFGNTRFPGKSFTADEHPGLSAR